MKKNKIGVDPFSEKIKDILITSSMEKRTGSLREKITAEVRNYSREVQDFDVMPKLFTRLCDLIVDCQTAGIPDESFRLLVAHLLLETSYAEVPLERELKALTGMDLTSIKSAREHLNNECVVSIMTGSTGKARKKDSDADGGEPVL